VVDWLLLRCVRDEIGYEILEKDSRRLLPIIGERDWPCWRGGTLLLNNYESFSGTEALLVNLVVNIVTCV
jgi:hypothetical protein